MPDEDQPGTVLQCTSVGNEAVEYEEVIVEYIFNRYEKKWTRLFKGFKVIINVAMIF
jgi:hypothetical protein